MGIPVQREKWKPAEAAKCVWPEGHAEKVKAAGDAFWKTMEEEEEKDNA